MLEALAIRFQKQKRLIKGHMLIIVYKSDSLSDVVYLHFFKRQSIHPPFIDDNAHCKLKKTYLSIEI